MAFITSSSSAIYGIPRIAVYSATKFAVKGLTEALSVEFRRHGVRVADVLPGLIDTAILRSTPNRTGDAPKPTDEQLYETAPKKGMFRLLPATAISETVWKAYHSDRLHWYVPGELVWLERLKGRGYRFGYEEITRRFGEEVDDAAENRDVTGKRRLVRIRRRDATPSMCDFARCDTIHIDSGQPDFAGCAG
jgi:hypothetical protein